MTNSLANRTQEKFESLKQQFSKSAHGELLELIDQNISWDEEFTKHFDNALLERYNKHSALLAQLSEQESYASGHLVKVVCQNGKVYEQALLRICDNKWKITVNGGGFITRDKLTPTGLSMSVAGGYTLTVDPKHLKALDTKDKNYQFSGTGRIEADCGINISKPIKRWILDDSNGQLGFY